MGDAQNIENFPLVLFATFVLFALFVPSPNFYLKKTMANG